VRDAAARGAKIVCLSELFSTMYFCVETRQEYFDGAEPIPGPTIDRMAEVARETGTVLIAPIFERARSTDASTTPRR
jgi:N-carbamoylputrescine amidase